MPLVSLVDNDGEEVSIDAEKVELLRLVGATSGWAINAVNKKGGVVIPLDSLAGLAIGGFPIVVRIVEPPASRRGLKRKRKRR